MWVRIRTTLGRQHESNNQTLTGNAASTLKGFYVQRSPNIQISNQGSAPFFRPSTPRAPAEIWKRVKTSARPPTMFITGDSAGGGRGGGITRTYKHAWNGLVSCTTKRAECTGGFRIERDHDSVQLVPEPVREKQIRRKYRKRSWYKFEKTRQHPLSS